MSSSLAWLATSAEEQRWVQDLIGLFRDTESRDELGIGQIRDVWSDTLFPGTSVLHTRARYLLFIPWCYQLAENAGDNSSAGVHRVERRLLAAMQDAGHTEGIIGRLAGVAVKTLPSTIYRSALRLRAAADPPPHGRLGGVSAATRGPALPRRHPRFARRYR
ncbi:MAG: DUF6361 family protein [Sciscionella sp.]